MKHLAAYAMLVLGGKEKPTAADVEKLMRDSGVTPDADKIKLLIEKIGDKPFHEHVAGGLGKLASMGTGAAAPAGAAAAAAPVEDTKKEEEEDLPMGNLFGDDDDDY